ncbi:hypothetical protein LTR37_009048 [Vermiconidia calcicola]|uniref:Uncharacterized protein n=1 Tax=Vermiconidia calcicola TaxID=1690605 RepID=A0ACC3N9A9_9PEZI|nr:hypothetical protein LTR37_009048 [Vermiconidia calcicola]
MPRVRASNAAKQPNYIDSPVKGVSIPLNDDRAEKAQRLQSRQVAHSKQIEQYKAAASPAKKRKSLGSGDGPQTPSQDPSSQPTYDVAGTAITPLKRPGCVPIMANFEEWMKMATDNKINATNSWNFALIDYFHDMSLLREGDGVNFQKASCTLDGCVKIYTSRVDSVAVETGRLLSGLAESKSTKKRRGEGEEGEEGEGEEGEEDEEGGKKKKTKKARSAEATLVSNWEQLRLKKMELEFSVDPLFKKASADFDEGGAKGLLLNHLSIDGEGRIVFDSSDDTKDQDAENSRRDSMDPEGADEEAEAQEKSPVELVREQDGPVDIAALGARFFPDLNKLETQDICPTLKTFELGAGDAAMDLPFLKAPENWRDEHPEPTLGADAAADQEADPTHLPDNNFGLNDDDDAGGFDLPPETGFGEGGEAWARDAALAPQLRVHSLEASGEDEGGEVGTFDTNSNTYGVTLQHRNNSSDQENILNYFDAALQKNWAGPEHWKIARIKEKTTSAATAKKETKKEKEPFEIDFTSPMSSELAAQLYTPAVSNAAISLPRKEWRSRSRNLLPDDKHFHSRDLLKLFLKPKARLGARNKAGGGSKPAAVREEEVEEAYWATNNNAPAPIEEVEAGVQGDYDADFFADDALPLAPGLEDDDPDDFADAREQFSPEVDLAAPLGPGIDGVMAGSQEGGDAFGANLVAQSRRLRPEYVQYARVAKKVDVRRLKEEMWRGTGFDVGLGVPPHTPASRPPLAKDDTGSLNFTSIMNNLQHVYPKQQMADISTSYGFICLLHLANEKGLVIENVDGWQDLTVRRDFEAVVTEGDL